MRTAERVSGKLSFLKGVQANSAACKQPLHYKAAWKVCSGSYISSFHELSSPLLGWAFGNAAVFLWAISVTISNLSTSRWLIKLDWDLPCLDLLLVLCQGWKGFVMSLRNRVIPQTWVYIAGIMCHYFSRGRTLMWTFWLCHSTDMLAVFNCCPVTKGLRPKLFITCK